MLLYANRSTAQAQGRISYPPISPTRFHWGSQSACHEQAPTGRRYMAAGPERDEGVLLFVRHPRSSERGVMMMYVCLGRAWHRRHRRAKPMQVEWELETAMPVGLYQDTKRVAG